MIHRIGTASNTAVHFFRDPAAPGAYGNTRRFEAHGSAMGLGDIIVRGKGTLLKRPRVGAATGVEVRMATGNEENLLGSGSRGIRVFEAVSFTSTRISPHVNMGYQWNGNTVLAGDVATGTRGDLPDEIFYVLGADVAVEQRLSMAFELLGRHSSDSPRLARRTFTVPGTSESFSDISFTSGSLNAISGAWGVKANVVGTALITFNLLFKLNNAGVRAEVTPLIGLEYGF
jgi:hypothetical protein